MFITLFVATSNDGFIADSFGNGNFSSVQDKTFLRSFLNSDKCDCYICGMKTAVEFQDKLIKKPLFILTKSPKAPEENRIYFSSIFELKELLNQQKLSQPVLLGGAETYHFFLENNLVHQAYITVEKDINFTKGIAFDFACYEKVFALTKTQNLSLKTIVYEYQFIDNSTN